MTRAFVSALLAAAALVPAVAQAQDERPARPERDGGRNREQPRPSGGQPQGGPQDGGQRFTPAPQPQQAQQPQGQQPQGQQQRQPQQPQQQQQAPQPQFRGRPQPQQAPQFDGQPSRGPQGRFEGQPGAGDRGRPGWEGRGPGGNGGFAPPPPAQGGPGQRPPQFGNAPRPGQAPGALWNGNRYDRAPGGYAPAPNGAWNRQWRGDQRYDWQRFRSDNRGAFRLPRYYAPRGWGYGYRRFSTGITLNALLFAPDYWIDDPYAYRLPPAYGPYRWVRYYNDALLVDVRTGLVVDTIYDIFW